MTSIAVAWACCLPEAHEGRRRLLAPEGYLGRLQTFGSFGRDEIVTRRIDFATGPAVAEQDLASVQLPGGADWSQFDLNIGGHEFLRAGWPLRCLEAEHKNLGEWDYSLAPKDNTTTWSVRVRASRRRSYRPFPLDGVLPLRPIALGFAADTLCYSLGWAIPFFGFPFTRRLLRRRRGLCPRCAYPLTGLAPNSPCPECGSGSLGTPP